MTSASAAILAQIQRDAFVWAKRNFGKSLTPETQLLGLGEEHGEAMAAIGDPDPTEFFDAIGDSTIFLMQFASLMGWSIGDLWEARECSELEMPPRPWPILIGRIYHSYVKGSVQHYRGTKAEHDEKCKAAIATLLLHWERRLALAGHDFVSIVELTWKKVAARDWTADRAAPGGEVPSDWQVPPSAHIPVALAGLQTLDVPVDAEDPPHISASAIERMSEEICDMIPAAQRMSEELSYDWAGYARPAGVMAIAAMIRRAYADGRLDEKRVRLTVDPIGDGEVKS